MSLQQKAILTGEQTQIKNAHLGIISLGKARKDGRIYETAYLENTLKVMSFI
jgi:hypothetical protein